MDTSAPAHCTVFSLAKKSVPPISQSSSKASPCHCNLWFSTNAMNLTLRISRRPLVLTRSWKRERHLGACRLAHLNAESNLNLLPSCHGIGRAEPECGRLGNGPPVWGIPECKQDHTGTPRSSRSGGVTRQHPSVQYVLLNGGLRRSNAVVERPKARQAGISMRGLPASIPHVQRAGPAVSGFSERQCIFWN